MQESISRLLARVRGSLRPHRQFIEITPPVVLALPPINITPEMLQIDLRFERFTIEDFFAHLTNYDPEPVYEEIPPGQNERILEGIPEVLTRAFVPEDSVCPISGQIINVPAYDSKQGGQTRRHFDLPHLARALETSQRNPMTNQPLHLDDVRIDTAKADEIQTLAHTLCYSYNRKKALHEELQAKPRNNQPGLALTY